MKKIIFIILASFITTGLHATKLRNGASADQKRIDEVWHALEKINENGPCREYYWLWRICKACKFQKIEDLKELNYVYLKEFNEVVFLKEFNEETINKFSDLAIIKNGAIDKETQEIIISSYIGTGDPKCYSALYPVASYVEKIPGYRLYKLLKR